MNSTTYDLALDNYTVSQIEKMRKGDNLNLSVQMRLQLIAVNEREEIKSPTKINVVPITINNIRIAKSLESNSRSSSIK
ncbi:MAG: hypothetical protein WBE34_04010 [Candidatus Nitrosopolaris sp.]